MRKARIERLAAGKWESVGVFPVVLQPDGMSRVEFPSNLLKSGDNFRLEYIEEESKK